MQEKEKKKIGRKDRLLAGNASCGKKRKVRNKTCTQTSLQQAQCLPTAFRVSLSFVKFHAPCVINSYSANGIAKWAHVKTKITQM